MRCRGAALLIWILLCPRGWSQQSDINGIEFSVVDLTTGQPINEFRVIAGVPAGNSFARDFRQRGGEGDVINWQPHTAKLAKGGNFVWPLERGWDQMALRIEADGYQPQRRLIKRKDGPKHLVIQLEKDAGIEVEILQPDGKPAAGASIATVLPQKNARVENGRMEYDGAPPPQKLGDRWRRPTIVRSDANGRATVATETDPASAVVIVHESGVRDVSFAQFRQLKRVDLRGWGRIEGRVLWGNKPGARERITFSLNRDEYGYPDMINCHAEAESDHEARFTFEHVIPGRVQVSRPVKVPDNEGAITEAVFDGLVTHVQVGSEKPTAVVVGGRGRKVVGKLVGRDNWEGVTLHFHPNAPHIGLPGDRDMWKGFSAFQMSPIGPLFFRNGLKPDKTGAFQFDAVLPGYYQLFISAPGSKGYAGSAIMNVPTEPADQEPEAMDLGVIEVKALPT